MIPTGGFSIIIHIVINAIASIGRFLGIRTKPLRLVNPILLFIVIVSAIFVAAGSLMASAIQNENNLDHLAFLTTECVPIATNQGENRVILRIDDIQAYAWSAIQKQMIADTLDRGFQPSLGVIPLDIREDFDLYGYLRNVRCNVEFALHGWDNIEPVPGRGEFGLLDEKDAKERLLKGISAIERLARTHVTTFIPPNNDLSPGSYAAIEDVEIPVISAEGSGVYDFDVTTFDYIIDQPVSVDGVVAGCEEIFTETNTCIVMIHPQNYAIDGEMSQELYIQYIELLDTFRDREYGSLTLQQYAKELEDVIE